MPGVALRIIRPEHGHGNASPPDSRRYPDDQAPFASTTSHSLRAESPIYDATHLSSTKPWYTRRICRIRVWIWIVLFFIAAVAIIGGVLGHYANNFGEKSGIPKQVNIDGIRSDYWYTIRESSDVVSKGYLDDLSNPQKGKNVLAYPEDVRVANNTHWQFLRAPPLDLRGVTMGQTCDSAFQDGRAFYYLANKTQRPRMRLGYNRTGYGLGGNKTDDVYEKEEIEVHLWEWKALLNLDQVWYAEKIGEERYWLINCDNGFKERRRLGRRWDGTTNGPEVVLLKGNGTSEEASTIWTVSSNIGGETIKITEPGWDSFE